MGSRESRCSRLHRLRVQRRLEARYPVGVLEPWYSDGDNPMSTGLTIEARLQIMHEVMLVVEQSDKVHSTDSPKADLFWVLRAVHTDGEPYRCSTKQLLIGTLRKSPVWTKILPFLEYNDTSCGRPKCQHGDYEHTKRTGKCTGKVYTSGQKYHGPTVPCTCQGFIQKDFK